jgi:cell division protein FtsB
MTARSTSNKQTEGDLTRAELQRIEERRHVETVIRDARRVRFPRRKASSAVQESPLKVQSTTPSKEPSRPLTPAEQERISERRHVEAVMRNSRRSRFKLQPKLRPAPAGGETLAGGAVAPPGSPAQRHSIHLSTAVFGAVIFALACALLGLTIGSVIQNSRLIRDLATLRQETSTLSGRQQSSVEKVEQALAQVARVETSLDAVKSSQEALESTLRALETGRANDAAQMQQRLSGVEEAAREGLAEVASRMDSEDGLAGKVDKLLALLQPSGAAASEQQTKSETSPAP